MRVLTIGGAGFIGHNVVGQLLDSGHEVAVLHRSPLDTPWSDDVTSFSIERSALLDHRERFARWRPDVVVDFIAYTQHHARQLLGAFRDTTDRVVVLSSADVYRNYDGFRGHPTADPDPTPLDEDAPLRDQLFPYRGLDIAFEFADDYDKILVENTLLGDADFDTTVLRLPAVYGPGDPQHRLCPYLARMSDRRPAIILQSEEARWRWSRGYVENVATAITSAATGRLTGNRVFNVADGPALTESEWVLEIGRAAGWTGELLTVDSVDLPPSLRREADWRYDLAVDTQRIDDELDHPRPVDLHEALRRTVRWQQAVGCGAVDYTDEDLFLFRS